MPIKGLFDDRGIGAGLPMIGRLRKGDRVPNKSGNDTHPVDLDYFRVTFEPQYEYLQPMWESLYGEQPDMFPLVLLVGQTVDDAFEYWKEDYTSNGTLLHRCDGEEQHRWYNSDNHMIMSARIKCAAPACACKPHARLKLIIPDFLDEAGVIGYFAASTGSLRDISVVYLYLRDMERTLGNLARVPFVFGRADRKVNVPKQEKQRDGSYQITGRMQTEKSLFYIHVHPDYAQMRVIPLLTGAIEEPAALPAPEPAAVLMTAEVGRQQLGSGLTRRIGTPAPVPSAEPPLSAPVEAWDRAAVMAQTSNLFRTPDDQELMLGILERDGTITSDMETDQVLVALREAVKPADVGAERAFTALSVTCHKKNGAKKVYYWLQTAEGEAVYAASRQVFRDFGMKEEELTGWDTPNSKHDLAVPLSVKAVRKQHPDGNLYWAVK
ncbi:MAG TPA: hypothetical protein VHO69_03455 [Phototrophicaceae bacterium]|nr:hypothetical protein [Phototrophicaceae bacterium]